MEVNNENFEVVNSSDNGFIIMEEKQVLLQNKFTKECVFIPLDEDIKDQFGITFEIEGKTDENNLNVDQEKMDNVQSSSKLWSPENTLLLISQVKELDEDFSNGVKKVVWRKISSNLFHKHSKTVSEKACETKWKTLIRTYKAIKLKNHTSGEKRRYWESYNGIDEIMTKKPEITPVATCSSTTRLKINRDPSTPCTSHSADLDEEDEDGTPKKEKISSHLKRKRSDKENRHKEKMNRLDRFNDLFEKIVEKM